ncbi:uncharacterized protein MELLADRAFT_90635 [Melampsora larici-populina 98AG31]|uniref:Uncharacterized protein n=1 Tax=Melampsora larici-populina (strain 98AG31 / pathotype 3-4-7) TaxID=747676 RepID=F4RXL2_MELLP|nr:uncharacterized protein MELLADRAFT_90635 [Melampsora larici-populina 98AG31]EGG02872.1 hypothetical protein MELLADRAFT_90635 [Melampsora larici-populina 98AG31]
MSNSNQKETNIANFNEIMRRTSNRLRGGSVPPPDSDVVVPAPVVANLRGTVANLRGQGRGRGRGSLTASSRNVGQKSVTPVVTLTVPGEENQTSSNAQATEGQGRAQSNSDVTPGVSNTSVIHSNGLLSRDNVDNVPNSKRERYNPPLVMPLRSEASITRVIQDYAPLPAETQLRK